MLTAAKFVLYIICRRIVTPSTQALALDHRNDIISNTIAVACGIIGMQFWSYLTLWRPLLPYGYSYKASCARPG